MTPSKKRNGRSSIERAGRGRRSRVETDVSALFFVSALRPENRPAQPTCQLFQCDPSEMRVAVVIQTRRPDRDRGFPRRDSNDAAADAALAGQADAIGEFTRAVIVSAC